MKQKSRTFRKLLSLTLCLIMVLGSVAVGGGGLSELFDKFAVKANAEETGYKTGDIIEFGSYPQSKVSDTELISELDSVTKSWTSYDYYSGQNSLVDGNMTSSDYMLYADFTYKGTEYRAVKINEYRPICTGYKSSDVKCCQDENGYTEGTDEIYYFRYEPIKWKILEPSTGLVLSDAILDSQAYNNYCLSSGKDEYNKIAYWGDSAKTYYANNYAESSIRDWLNDDFCNTAFSDDQQNIIKSTVLDNSAYSTSYSAYDSVSTTDKIYLLSYSDVLNSGYGFSTSTSSSSTRTAQGTDYAKCQGLYVYSGNSHWLLRSAGYYSYFSSGVGYDGYVNYYNFYYTNYTDIGVRAALNLNLKSEVTLNANNGADEPQKNTVTNFKSYYPECTFTNGTKTFCGWYKDAECQQPWNETDIVYEDMTLYAGWTDYKQGETIEFGSYPQSKVSDTTLISELDSVTKSWTSYDYYSGKGSYSDGKMTSSDYMQYADFTYKGTEYRAVKINNYRPYYTGFSSSAKYSYQDENGYTAGTDEIYYFRYEPIKWNILDPATGLVLTDAILDSQAYNNYIWYGVGSKSTSSEYYGDAAHTYYANNYAESSIRDWLNDDFCNTAFSDDQQNIIKSNVLDNSAYSTSYSAYDSASTADKIYLLSYSDAQNSSYGFSTSTGSSSTRTAQGTDYAKCQGLYVYSSNGNSYWRLRSAGTNSNDACYVSINGDVGAGCITGDTCGGVRAALNLNLESEIFKSEITADMVEDIPDCKYTGEEFKPAATVKDGEKTLTENTDYTVSYNNNTNAGTATVTIKGISNYCGEVTTTFKINAKTLTEEMISGIYNASYTGKPIEWNIVVKDGDKTLTENTDYTVSYKDNTNAGTATVTITGIGNYCGAVTEKFTISPAAQSAPTGITSTDETKCSASDGTISGLSTDMEIAFEREEYTPCTGETMTGLAHGTYSIRYAGSANYVASDFVQVVIKEGDCYGGTATCVSKAVCDGCHNEYGELDNNNHAFNKVEFTWSKSYDVCTAKFTCQNDAKHTKDVKCDVKKEITIEPTCTTQGEYTCTATVNFEGKTYTDVQKYSIPVKEHEWETDYTVDKEPTYSEAGSESIHCKHCEAVKDSRSIISVSDKFEIERANVLGTLEALGRKHTSRWSQNIIAEATESIESYVYDEGKSFDENVQAISAIRDDVTEKVNSRHNFIYGCPFLRFFANILEPVFSLFSKLFAL